MKRKQNNNGPAVYNIGTVSRICALPVYTIRWLEQNELIFPQRTGGNQRLYTQSDLALLQEISVLLNCSVNLQGIKVILQIKQRYNITITDLDF